MQKVFIEGGLIRNLWDGETNAYRDHLLRLDPESRRNRLSGRSRMKQSENLPQLHGARTSSCTAFSSMGCSAARLISTL